MTVCCRRDCKLFGVQQVSFLVSFPHLNKQFLEFNQNHNPQILRNKRATGKMR